MTSSSVGDSSLGEYLQQQNQSSQNAITAFLAKLWALVNDPTCNDLIAWDGTGNSFHVYDQARFSREILPRYFKHNNFASFIRQLNMYGFRKMSTIEHGSLKNERDDIEFAHPSFLRGQESLLEFIKRRAPDNQPKQHLSTIKAEVSASPSSTSSVLSTQQIETKPVQTDEFGHILDDVRNLHSKQSSLSDKLFHLQDENQALWREVGSLRQKHSKQQQIVSKLMEFLLHLLTSSTQNHRRSVEQPLSNQSQQEQTSHQTTNLESIANRSLKRKPAAIMHTEEPNKRTTLQQQQQQQQAHLFTQPIIIGGQQQQPQRIVINELTENDMGGWQQNTHTSPLVDLVPSPPPSASSSSALLRDDHYHLNNNYEWIVPTNELTNPMTNPSQSKLFKTGNDGNDSFLPDFFLNADDDHNDVHIHNGSTLTDINTVNIDADYFFDLI